MGPKKVKFGAKPAPAPSSKPPAQATQAGQANSPKKKKKNDPLRPQPAWLFPPDDENPILNPRNKSQEEIQMEIDERLAAIRFLDHRSVSAPVKTAPPSELLQLIASFLASYGFVSTGRIFSLERNARRKLDGWNDEIGEKKFAKNQPNLVTIFKDWRVDWKGDSDEDTSSSGEDSEQDVPMKDADSSSDDSDDESSEDEKEVKAAKPKPVSNGTTTLRTTLRKSIKKESPSKEPSTNTNTTTASESTSESDSESDSEEEAGAAVPVVKTKSQTPKKLSKADSKSDSSSDSSSDSESDEEDQTSAAPKIASIITNQIAKLKAVIPTAGSESSETLKGDSPPKDLSPSVSTSSSSASDTSSSVSPSDSDSGSDSDAAPKSKKSTTKPQSKSSTKRKAMSPVADDTIPTADVQSSKKAKTTKESFSRIPKDIQIDPRLASNKYVSYDYADKAHRDLIVTKGKGFTKEKNKKKRGAYRGGRIDTEGGKGVKFDD